MRVISFDLLRTIAIFAVIVIHAQPFSERHFPEPGYRYLEVFLNQGSRFAVPFFFVLSGYFFGKKLAQSTQSGDVFLGYARRLLFIFLFWSAIYVLVPSDILGLMQYGYLKLTYWKVQKLVSDPIALVLQGGRIHLWFVVSLIMALAFVSLVVKCNLRRFLIPLGVVLYIAGLLGGSYSVTSLGFQAPFNTRDGPFFSTILVAVGYWLSLRQEIRVSLRFALWVAGAGMALHFAEVFGLWRFYDVSPLQPDYVLGTLVWGIGMMLIAVATRHIQWGTRLARAGEYTLGIYVVHLLFVDMLSPMSARLVSPVWELMLPVIVYACSLAFVVILSKNTYLRRVVL